MQSSPDTSRTRPALNEAAHAAGRIAVLVLFTGLFAATWNGDGPSSNAPGTRMTVQRAMRATGRDSGDATALSVSVCKAGRIAVGVRDMSSRDFAPHGPVLAGLGRRVSGSMEAEPTPRMQFLGTPALLGGTLELGENFLANPSVDPPAVIATAPDEFTP